MAKDVSDGRPPIQEVNRAQPRQGEINGKRPSSLASIGEDLLDDLIVLFKQQGRLLGQEAGEKAQVVKASGASMAIGVVMILVGVVVLASAAVIGLAYVLPIWAAALIVAAFFLVAGGALWGGGMSRLDADHLTPRKSLDTFQQMKIRFQEKVDEYKRSRQRQHSRQ